MQEVIITANEAGQRFDKLLVKYLNAAPKSFIYKMLRKKNIVLNDKKAAGNEKLIIGDRVKLFLADDTIEKFSQIKINTAQATLDYILEIIYEDAHILLINKPVGMLSQKAKVTDESVVEQVIAYMLQTGQITQEELRRFKPSVCNRLDRNTSGIIVAGKSLEGLQTMAEMFKMRTIQKYYQCLVLGTINDKQYLKGYLSKDSRTNKVTVTNTELPESQIIETEYVPLWSSQGVTLLEVHLITGKTHQIRAHLASVGHPIIGDHKYGTHNMNQQYKKAFGLESQLLHAYRLRFPVCKGALNELSDREFIASLPTQFQEICKAKRR